MVHARRLLFDDRESKEIVLNDTDINQGTQAKYYLQIFDRRFESSKHRDYQLTVLESPLEYFFNFNYKLNSFRVSAEDVFPLPFTGALANKESESDLLPRDARVDFVPISQTQFLMRVDNLADHFDGMPSDIHYLEFESLK